MKFPKVLIERFNLIVAVLSVFIIYVGFANLYFYYMYFKIDIFEFISISEIATTAFTSIFIVLFPFAFTIFLFKRIILRAWKVRFESHELEKILSKPRYVLFAIIILTMAGFYTIYYFNIKLNPFLEQGIYIFFYVVLSMITIFGFFNIPNNFINYENDEAPEIPKLYLPEHKLTIAGKETNNYIESKKRIKNAITVITYIFLFLCYYWVFNYFKITMAKSINIQYSFLLSDSTTLVTDANKIYIGKTQDYYFFYDITGKFSTVYPKSEIKKIDKRDFDLNKIKYIKIRAIMKE